MTMDSDEKKPPTTGPDCVDCFLYFLFFVGIGLWIVLPFEPVFARVLGTLFIVFHLIHALCFGRTGASLRNIMSETDFRDYIERLQKAQPEVKFVIECYHWEEHEDSNGGAGGQPRAKTRKKVVTHKASAYYPIQGFTDETLSPDETMAMFHLLHDGSRDGDDIEEPLVENASPQSPPTSLFLLCDFPLEFWPASTACRDHLDKFRKNFEAANRRDDHQNCHTHWSCEGHIPQLMVTLRSGMDTSYDRPWWMSYSLFFVLTLLGLSFPYSCFFLAKCTAVDWKVLKHFSHLPKSAWKDQMPAKSRLRRHPGHVFGGASGRDGGAANALPEGGSSTRDDPRNRAEIAVVEAPPAYWSNKREASGAANKMLSLLGSGANKVRLANDQHHHFQSLLDATFRPKATRDRVGGRLPRRLKVCSVLRLELPLLWKRYVEKQRVYTRTIGRPTLVRDQPGSGDLKTSRLQGPFSLAAPGLNEAYLFHGSSPSGALGISDRGFAMAKAGSKTGCMFGAGAYFAECSSKGDEYAVEEKSGAFGGKFALMLCRVTLGRPFYTMEPDRDRIAEALKSGHYQSVLGDRERAVGTYREFVVFEEDQIYPEYVIIYEREYS